MKIQLSGKDMQNSWCIYTIEEMSGKMIFIWYSKVATALSGRELLSNPAFDTAKPVIVTIQQIHATQRDAQAAIAGWFAKYGMPDLNKTVRWNRRTRVKCHETGQVFKNQLECARMLGIDQSQLSKVLRRIPGHVSINGLTFSNIADDHAVKPVQQFKPDLNNLPAPVRMPENSR